MTAVYDRALTLDVQQVARLIGELTAHDPAQRPTAKEVLRSELLPPTVGDQQLADLLRSLPDKYAHVLN